MSPVSVDEKRIRSTTYFGTNESDLFGLEDFPDSGCKRSAHERTYDEDPEVRESRATLEECRTYGAGGIDGGAGVADAEEVREHECQADGKPCEVIRCAIGLGCSTKDDENKDGCEYDFGQHPSHDRNAGLEVVCSGPDETAIGGQKPEDGGAEDGTDNLKEDVQGGIFAAHSSGEKNAKCDGRIDVASGDAANSVGHGYYREPESKSSPEDGCRISRIDDAVGRAIEADGDAAPHQSKD